MVEAMKKVAALGQDLTVEERNLLSVAYKVCSLKFINILFVYFYTDWLFSKKLKYLQNVIGSRRQAWRIIRSIEDREISKGEGSRVDMVKEYRVSIILFEKKKNHR